MRFFKKTLTKFLSHLPEIFREAPGAFLRHRQLLPFTHPFESQLTVESKISAEGTFVQYGVFATDVFP